MSLEQAQKGYLRHAVKSKASLLEKCQFLAEKSPQEIPANLVMKNNPKEFLAEFYEKNYFKEIFTDFQVEK